jgi:HSP20 family protein
VLISPCYDADVAFARWDPLRDLLALHEQLGHLVGTDAPGWTPPVDLYETAGEFVLSAELPGLTREQIEIHAEDGRITIRGARTTTVGREISCEQYHRVERGHGSFSRTFALPEAIDVDAITADLRDGVLTIMVPKATNRAARRINVT